MQGELKSTIEESKLVQEKYKVLLEQVRKELTNKHHECEDLKSQVLRLYYTIDVVEYICTCVNLHSISPLQVQLVGACRQLANLCYKRLGNQRKHKIWWDHFHLQAFKASKQQTAPKFGRDHLKNTGQHPALTTQVQLKELLMMDNK